MRGRLIAITAAAALLAAAVATAQPASSSDKADALSAAARKGDAAAVKALLDEGVDVNTKYRYGVTVLIYACDHGNLDVVKLLLDRGADVNVKDSFYGATPLALAVSPAQKKKPTHIEIVKLLLAHGAGPKDEALMSAVSDSDAAMTKVILDSGGISGKTLSAALESAKNEKQTEIVALLEHAGAKPAPEVSIDPVQLARYAGTYRNSAGNELVFTIKDGKLTGGPAAQSFTLAASDSKSFRIVGAQGVTLSFLTEGDKPDGKVTGLALTQGGSTTNYTRVEGK
jgi:ankyrin repeat protein